MLGLPLGTPVAKANSGARLFTPKETAIIFDWDDTLFPTWHVLESLKETLPADAAFHASLERLSGTVRELLRLAKTCGQVAIVTLSRRPWVANSASQYMRSLEIEKLLKELSIPVIYSRECVKKHMMRSPDGEFEEGVCPLTMAKEQAMKKVLKKLYGKNPWSNVLSIGDSVTERTAITELLWASGDARSCCKTLKMLQALRIRPAAVRRFFLFFLGEAFSGGKRRQGFLLGSLSELFSGKPSCVCADCPFLSRFCLLLLG
ncbi:unnamed protein product [Effrenium voratum]|nr:unnamed protein product [Effrenium voratum]